MTEKRLYSIGCFWDFMIFQEVLHIVLRKEVHGEFFYPDLVHF
jgi:hypothetical protein